MKLKPCPFCGKSVNVIYLKHRENSSISELYTIIHRCDDGISIVTDKYRSKLVLERNWNTRAFSQTPSTREN